MFFWRVSTFSTLLERLLPKTHAALLRLADTIGTPRYDAALRRIYPQLENISVDYAILEPASRDPPAQPGLRPPRRHRLERHRLLGRRLRIARRESPAKTSPPGRLLALDAAGNFLWSPHKFVAAIGIRDLVVVETPDALLICPRDRAQDVGRIVK